MKLPWNSGPLGAAIGSFRWREMSEVGLPGLLSIAGVIIALVIVLGASLANWIGESEVVALGDESDLMSYVAPADHAGDALYASRQIGILRARIEELQIRYEQVAAGNERLARELAALKEAFGPPTGSLARAARPAPAGTLSAGSLRKTNRMSEHHKPATAANEAPRNASQTLFALQLGTFRSESELINGWQALRRRAEGSLRNLDARAYAARAPGQKLVYRLLAGPIRNAADAAARCARLSDLGVDCATTVFAGASLPHDG